MTSSCSSRVAWLIAFGLTACTDSGPKVNPCINDDSPSVPGSPDEVITRGRVSFRTKYTYDGAGTLAKPDVTVGATFTDNSQVIRASRPPSTLPNGSPACYALTGSPTDTICRPGYKEPCTLQYLDVSKVTVSGVSGGPLDLTKTSMGNYNGPASLGDPLYNAGQVTVTVSGQSAAGSFPSYEQSIGTPDPMVIESPKPGDPTPITPRDLIVKWKKGNGDFVVIDLSLVIPGQTDKLQCVLLDDGCTTIYRGDIEFLCPSAGCPDQTKVKITVTRKLAAVRAIDPTTTVEIGTSSIAELVVSK
jgi:hypothetical protein